MANGAFLAVPDADPEMVPDSFSISWQYDNFLMTFANGAGLHRQPDRELGRLLRRQPRLAAGQPPGLCAAAGGRAGAQQGRSAAAADGGRRHARCRRHRRSRRAAPRRRPRRPGGGRGGNLPPVEAKVYVNPRGGVEEDYPLDAHTRNFLDCIKSRQKPNAEFEIGYYAALPCLLALESLQKGKPLGWDAQARSQQGAVDRQRRRGATASRGRAETTLCTARVF